MNTRRPGGGKQGLVPPVYVLDELRRLLTSHRSWAAARIRDSLCESMDYDIVPQTVRRYRKRWGLGQSRRPVDPDGSAPGSDPGEPAGQTLERLIGYIVVPDAAKVPGNVLTHPDGLHVLDSGHRPVRVVRDNRRIGSCWLTAAEERVLLDHLAESLPAEHARALIGRYSRLRNLVTGYLRRAEEHNFDLLEGLASIAYSDLEAAIRGGHAIPAKSHHDDDDLAEGMASRDEGNAAANAGLARGAKTEEEEVWWLLEEGPRLRGLADELVADLRLAMGI